MSKRQVLLVGGKPPRAGEEFVCQAAQRQPLRKPGRALPEAERAPAQAVASPEASERMIRGTVQKLLARQTHSQHVDTTVRTTGAAVTPNTATSYIDTGPG